VGENKTNKKETMKMNNNGEMLFGWVTTGHSGAGGRSKVSERSLGLIMMLFGVVLLLVSEEAGVEAVSKNSDPAGGSLPVISPIAGEAFEKVEKLMLTTRCRVR